MNRINMSHRFFLLFLAFLIVSCGVSDKKKQNIEIENITVTAEIINEAQKFEMFCTALKNQSTTPNYVVVMVKNLNTGEVKEICTEAPFVEGAIYRQTGKFSFTTDCNDYPNRYFEFSADSALWNISFNLYTISELEEYANSIDVEKIVQHVKDGILQKRTFGFDDEEFEQYLRENKSKKEAITTSRKQNWEEIDKQQVMFAHIMFNNGIMMTRGCIAGNICELYTYDEVKKENQIPIIEQEEE